MAHSIVRQSLRFGLVGVLANAALYGMYVGLVKLGVSPLISMSASYAAGVLLGFFGNRQWTFSHRADARAAFRRYVALYVSCYIGNFLMISILVYGMGLSAFAVQAFAVALVAVATFFAQKYWVFPA